MIELHHLFAGYGKHRVLSDLSTAIPPAKFTCVLGPNGCGKSTLLKTILGILPPEQGSLPIDGQSVSTMKPQAVAQKIAYLAQEKTVPAMTVAQLVLHGRFAHLKYPRVYRPIDHEIAAEAMKQMGLSQFSDGPLSTLSGGYRQAAYIAMALAQGSDYILLDEPTTHLDIANQLQLMHTLKRLSYEGKGILTVLHDIPLALEFADRILVMQEGHFVFDGSPDQLADSSVIEAVFGVKLCHSETAYSIAPDLPQTITREET